MTNDAYAWIADTLARKAPAKKGAIVPSTTQAKSSGG